MNKATREKIRDHGLPTRQEWDDLCDYVDELEAACEQIDACRPNEHIVEDPFVQVAVSCKRIAREALAKGKD